VVTTALERAAVRWRTAAVVHSADLLTDVRNLRRVTGVLGPAATARAMRELAARALEHHDPEVRSHAVRLLAEIDRRRAHRGGACRGGRHRAEAGAERGGQSQPR
jgi:hypothetical protein